MTLTCTYIFLGITGIYDVICCSLFSYNLHKECKNNKKKYKIIHRNNMEEDATEFDTMLKTVDNGKGKADVIEESKSIFWSNNKPFMPEETDEVIIHQEKAPKNIINYSIKSNLETLYE